MGLHDRVLADLAPFTGEHPGRERLVAAHMTALYRAGRQTEALELHRATRDHLVTEPGPALTTLHERILNADPRLDRTPAPLYAVRVREEWLPWSTGGHPALEFCDTYAGRHRTPAVPGSDGLRTYRTLTLRACPSDDCGWLFPDTTGRRRWRATATCGAGRS
ncbi:BTAD domain-containing putative transcriptional regulator [Streptomyces sp. NPDC093089]|uniref:BTAD domain-containing putative transcriptional regulator n=1 Tax=Streptomyces sp. NPDC093089 TaxID=3366024 RepID=UPI0037F28BE5